MRASVLLAIVACSVAMKLPHQGFDVPMEDDYWKEFKVKFGKFYKSKDEELEHYRNWLHNIKEVERHNALEKGFTRGMNEFFDMSEEEFRKIMGSCLKLPKYIIEGNVTEGSAFLPPFNVQIPETVDWRTAGYVTRVKNQGQCGSCWAFSSTGSLEGQTFRKTGKLPDLSEQNLIDCTEKYGNQACNGGWMDNSFKYVRDNAGIDNEVGYPYYARALGYCYYNARYNTASDTGFVDIPSGDENALKIAVATIGPISVAIDATHASFMSYRSGVYYEPACGNGLANLDHAVLVVGYGTENGRDYWLVKNSWGTTWGDAGYIKMTRNYYNQCGIATKASYPIV